MSFYCINPFCDRRENPNDIENCLCCGTSLLINDRIRLVKPLRKLTKDPFSYFDVFEVDDAGTEWNPVRKRRVMKILKWNTPKLVNLIEAESIALQIIQHPKIPETTPDDFFTFVPNNSSFILHCLVMDKFEGINLEEWLKSNGCISQSLALEWLKQLVDILDTIHRSDFFHRDIKPSNIILQPNGELALVDFGTARRLTNTYLAKVSGSGGTDTGRGGRYEITAVVTPRYTPLEQIEGQAVPQSDFFALGRTIVNLVTGIPLVDLSKNQQTGRLNWRKHAPQIDKPFADLIDELMAPFPGQRPQTTRVVLQRLQKLPLQSKIHKLIRSKPFLLSTTIVFISLLSLGNIKIVLPQLANTLITGGEKLETANNSQKAQYLFDQAVKINPEVKLSISKFYLEKAARIANDLEKAKQYYESAIKYNSEDVEIYNSLALICEELNQSDCVIDNYQKVLSLQPNNWQAHYGLGTFYDEKSEYNLAEQQYRIVIKLNKEAVGALNNLSRLKTLNGNYVEAITLTFQGLKLAKTPEQQAALYKNLGWGRLMQKKYSEAEEYLQKALDLDQTRTDAACLLSQAQEALGKFSEARNYWEVCIVLESNQPEVFKWRGELLDRLINQSKKAK